MKKFELLNLLALLLFLLANGQEYQTILTEDGTLAYQTFGKGYPVLIINGGPGMHSEGFIPLAKMLSENNTTVIYDQRGTGRSEMDEVNSANISLAKMVEDIEVLREHLGYEDWIVLGHSFGGMLAYAYAAEYPERITAMIQSHSGGLDLDLTNGFDITSRLTTTERDSLAHYSLKIHLGDHSEETALKRAEFLAPAYLYDKSLAPRIAGRLTQGNSRINSLVWNDMHRIQFDVSSEMSRFAKPVLILNGEDEVASTSIAEKAARILPDARLVLMEKCGHYGWLERPEIYLKEVKEFIETNSAENTE